MRAASVSAASAAATATVSRVLRICARRVDLRLAHRRVVDLAHVHRVFVVEAELVDADDHVLAAVDARLLLRRRRLDLELGPARLDGARHAAHRLDFLEDRPRLVGHVLGQPLHEVGAAPRVDHAA